MATAAVYLILAATVFAPVDTHGTRVVHLTIHSRAVGDDLGVSVVVPGGPDPARKRPLLVFLHGRGGSDQTFSDDEAMFKALARLGVRAPIVAFPDGGDHSYWHDRADGRWGSYVMQEVIPPVIRRFGVDPRRIAIGGISMGGFGAYDLALLHPGRFCAVGGHSPALWLAGADTAPGAFDDAEDFNRNDVVRHDRARPGRLRRHPDLERRRQRRPVPQTYDEGFVAALTRGGAAPQRPLVAGRAQQRLLGRALGTPTSASTPTPWRAAERGRRFSARVSPAGGVPGGGDGPQLVAAVGAVDRHRRAADRRRVERGVGDRLDAREDLAHVALVALAAPVMEVGGEAGRVDPGRVGEVQRPRHVEALGDDDRACATPKMLRARTIVAQVSKPAWSSKMSRGGTPSRTSALRIVSGSS